MADNFEQAASLVGNTGNQVNVATATDDTPLASNSAAAAATSAADRSLPTSATQWFHLASANNNSDLTMAFNTDTGLASSSATLPFGQHRPYRLLREVNTTPEDMSPHWASQLQRQIHTSYTSQSSLGSMSSVQENPRLRSGSNLAPSLATRSAVPMRRGNSVSDCSQCSSSDESEPDEAERELREWTVGRHGM